MKLFGKFTDAAGAGLGALRESITALSTDLQDRAANAADVRHLLRIIDMIPGIKDEIADYNDLRKSLAVIQMGRLSCFITFDDTAGLGVGFSRTGTITLAALRDHIADQDFTATVLSEGADADETIHMIVNKTRVLENKNSISAELLATALLLPVGNVPLVGGVLSSALHPPTRAIALLLVNSMTAIAGGALNLSAGLTKLVP